MPKFRPYNPVVVERWCDLRREEIARGADPTKIDNARLGDLFYAIVTHEAAGAEPDPIWAREMTVILERMAARGEFDHIAFTYGGPP